MEKFQPNERPVPKVVGAAPEQERREYRDTIMERFGERHFDQFPKNGESLRAAEYDKRHHEIACIEAINHITNKLLEEAGMTPFDVPVQNIHLLPHERFVEAGDGSEWATGMIFHHQQAAFVDAERARVSPVYVAAVLLHEITHLKEPLVLQVGEQKDNRGKYRAGVRVESTFKKDEKAGGAHVYFSGLQEAIVSTIEKKYLPKLVAQIPELQKEAERLMSPEALEYKKKIAEKNDTDPEEITWVSQDGVEWRRFGYRGPRKVLQLIVDTIYEDNPSLFASRDDAESMFIKAHLNGRLLEIAKLVEKSFGEGSFRSLGEMSEKNDAAYAKYVGLSRARRKVLKERERS